MKTACLLLLLLAPLSSLTGQESAPSTTPDTSGTRDAVLLEPGFAPTIPILPPALARDVLPEEMLWTLPAGNSAPPMLIAKSQPIDIMLPLRLQMASEKKLGTLRTILATVQIGGVAYLAYEHIRKHGLFK